MQRQLPLVEAYEALGMAVKPRTEAPRILISEQFCPGCAGLLAADVHPEGFEGYVSPRLGAVEVGPLEMPA